jgi:hypothetical protein
MRREGRGREGKKAAKGGRAEISEGRTRKGRKEMQEGREEVMEMKEGRKEVKEKDLVPFKRFFSSV